MARPGALDRTFDPELRAAVTPSLAMLAPDGRAWIGGGFDRGDGWSTGDLVRLGANGGVDSEPALGYISKTPNTVSFTGFGLNVVTLGAPGTNRNPKPFLLQNGDFLLSGESGGWLRMNSAGEALGTAFPDRLTDETITPQFERDGHIWTIRTYSDGASILEKRNNTDGALDSAFPATGTLPEDARSAVPAPDGGVWLFAGAVSQRTYLNPPSVSTQRVLHLNAAGEIIGTPILLGNRFASLSPGPEGSFRVVLGDDPSRWMYWPSPELSSHRIQWYSQAGVLTRHQDFSGPLGKPFAWAEAADGSFVAQNFPRGGGMVIIARPASAILQRFSATGVHDPSFKSPGSVSSVIAVENGKWLVDGTRLLNADGSENSSWNAPHLTTPATVSALAKLPDGRILAGGNFESVDGEMQNRLAAYHPDGTLDPSFTPDARIGAWRSLAVSGNAIYAVTENAISYGQGHVSQLVKLRLDGSLDETFLPRHSEIFLNLYMQDVAEVHAINGGDILTVSHSGGEVFSESIQRYKPDGSRDKGFKSITTYNRFGNLMTLANGGFVKGGVFYKPDGTVARDISIDQVGLMPLCETPRGVLFMETRNGPSYRLRLWTGRAWAAWFRGPEIKSSWGIRTTPGDAAHTYLVADFKDTGPALARLLPNGRLDRSFRTARFGYRLRQHPGEWWIAEETGKAAFNPARHEVASPPRVLLWDSHSRSLWTGGAFNTVDRQPRDGLARIIGGFSTHR